MIVWEEPEIEYMPKENFPLKEETFEIIGICMEVHRILGKGLLEVVYKDAIEYELTQKKIKYEREKIFKIQYKEIILPHFFVADFVVNGIIVEIKAQNKTVEEHYSQIINYISISKSKVGLLINFWRRILKI